MRAFKDSTNKLKRQIELSGLCLSDKKKYSKPNLAAIFNCEEPTIKRDLEELRSYGIDIHSTKKKGVHICNRIEPEILSSFITHYLSFVFGKQVFDKASSFLINQLKERGLINIVLLQRAIENKSITEIDYRIDKNKIINIKIEPLTFFQSDGEWRLLAVNDHIVKQYLLTKIISVHDTEISFSKRELPDIEELFRFSFKSWLGNERYDVELLVTEPLYLKLRNRISSKEADQKIITGKRIKINLTVNSLNEIAEWIVSKGANVKVISPGELKTKVISLAKEALKNYK